MKHSTTRSNGQADDFNQRTVTRSKFRYRILVSRTRKEPEVLWLTNDFDYARQLVEQIENRTGELGLIKRCWIQEWIGHPRSNPWRRAPEQPVPEKLIANANHRQRFASLASTAKVPDLKSGDRVEAILLAERTRRGGWRAQLRGSDLIGPISNSDEVPTILTTGQTVVLQIGSVNVEHQRIHFRWTNELK